MLVREVMTSPAVTVGPGETVGDAIRLLDRLSITAVPVVDEGGRPVGVVSEADLMRDVFREDLRPHRGAAGPGDDPQHTVGDVMTCQVLSVSADGDLVEAVGLMDGTAVKSLPVLLHGRVVGVISRRDIIATLARSDSEAARAHRE